MHDTAYKHGKLFFDLYCREGFNQIVDLGSQDVNGSLRDHCPPGATYIGVDMQLARGVDVVVSPGGPLPFREGSIDCAVTSSCFEHDVCFWETFIELLRIVRPGGLIYLNVPSNSYFHRYPLDCWRFYPDAGFALVEWARRKGLGAEVIESFVAHPEAEGWCDFVGIFRKPNGLPLYRQGRIAEHTRCMNIFDHKMASQTKLELESSHTPDTLALLALRSQVEGALKQIDEGQQQYEALNQAWASERAVLIQTYEDALSRALSDGRFRSDQLKIDLDQALKREEEARQVIHRMRESCSWRVMAPIRRLTALFARPAAHLD